MPSYLRHPTKIPEQFEADILKDCGEPFAISYLSGAMVHRQVLVPWTETAWIRLRQSRPAMEALERAGLKLQKPYPFGHPGHPASQQLRAAE